MHAFVRRAHYRGRLSSNGREFDASYPRGRPLAFKVGVGEVIKGWDLGIVGGEGIPPMRAGGKRTLVVPASLGYGARGAGNVIPPGAKAHPKTYACALVVRSQANVLHWTAGSSGPCNDDSEIRGPKPAQFSSGNAISPMKKEVSVCVLLQAQRSSLTSSISAPCRCAAESQ